MQSCWIEAASAASTRQVLTAQLSLNYRAYGAGPVIVILHGLLGSSRNWHSVAKHLAPRYRVVAVDLRNHGDSPHAEQLDYPTLAADLMALLDTLACGPVTLLGHSMGGKVAMQLALSAGARLQRLVVVDIAPVRYSDRFGFLLDAMQALPLAQLHGRAAADAELSAKIADPQLRQFLLQNLSHSEDGLKWRANLTSIRAHLDTILGFPSVEPGRQFAHPTLFIRGALSDSLDEAHHRAILALFPHAQIQSIDTAGHWPHVERRDDFLKMLDSFLAQG